MTAAMLRYEIGASSEREILEHLLACDRHFVPPLSERLNIHGYAQKLAQNALTIEAWCGSTLVGLVAAYANAGSDFCHVSNVSVLPAFHGHGIATRLLGNLVAHPACEHASEILLEVAKGNADAIILYSRLGFRVTGERADLLTMRYARKAYDPKTPKGREA